MLRRVTKLDLTHLKTRHENSGVGPCAPLRTGSRLHRTAPPAYLLLFFLLLDTRGRRKSGARPISVAFECQRSNAEVGDLNVTGEAAKFCDQSGIGARRLATRVESWVA